MEDENNHLWFIYDGDCPICKKAAMALRIRRAAGQVKLLNARTERDHPLLQEIREQGLNLDENMVIKYHERFYAGSDALHLMALMGSQQGWFNRLNARLFRRPSVARLAYPLMRAARNMLLAILGVGKIRNLDLDPGQPLFRAVLGAHAFDSMPRVFKTHYALPPFSPDQRVANGHLDIRLSPFMRFIARLSGQLISRPGKNIPVTVTFKSDKDGAFLFRRVFHYPNDANGSKQTVEFNSRMIWLGGNVLVEMMRFGFGWKLSFEWDGQTVFLRHEAYVWRCLGRYIPVPLGLILGRGHAEEIALGDDSFQMWTHIHHRLWGERFYYSGSFEIVKT